MLTRREMPLLSRRAGVGKRHGTVRNGTISTRYMVVNSLYVSSRIKRAFQSFLFKIRVFYLSLILLLLGGVFHRDLCVTENEASSMISLSACYVNWELQLPYFCNRSSPMPNR